MQEAAAKKLLLQKAMGRRRGVGGAKASVFKPREEIQPRCEKARTTTRATQKALEYARRIADGAMLLGLWKM